MSKYTNEKKAEKFNLLLEEYNRLMSYRHNLAGTVIRNIESIMEEKSIKQGEAYVLIQVDKKLDPQSITAIQAEIFRIDIVISFINAVIFDDEKSIFDSNANNINQNPLNENTGQSTSQA
jgi:hypothetical protein